MEICLATRNKGKLGEIAELLAPYAVSFRPVSDFSDAEPVEDGGSYLANATIKARAAAKASSLPSLADDAGIEFDALPGRFGVETAPEVERRGGWERIAPEIVALVASGKPATVRHHVTYVLCRPDGTEVAVKGIVPGTFVYPGRGDDWGFNNYFMPEGEAETYAEIKARRGLAAKNALSARGVAMAKIVAMLGLSPK